MKDLRFALAASSCLALTTIPSITNAGYFYEALNTNEAPGLPGAQVSTVYAWVDGDSAKIEFQDAAQAGLFQPGSYLVTTDAGDTLYLINPEKMTITEIDFDQILGMASSMMDAMGGVVNMEFSDLVNEKLSEGPGDDILGYDTTLSHYQTGYTMSISVMGFNRDSRVETDNKVWCSDDFDAGGLRVWLRPDRFRTGNDNFDELISQQYEAMNCLPLRNEVITTTSGMGDTTVTTTTTEVVQMREENVDPSVFALPADYEEVSMMDIIAGEMQNQGGQEEADSVMPNFGDLFNR